MNNFDLLKSPLKGKNLIEASAGTGKTYTIAGLFLRLIVEKSIPVDKILVVTFTEAATEELRGRIRNLLKQAFYTLSGRNLPVDDELVTGIFKKFAGNERVILQLKDALTRFDEASICTIHGFCRRMLSENAFESKSLLKAELITDNSKLIQKIIADFWRKRIYLAPPVLLQYLNQKKITPSYLLILISNYSIDPDLTIIPGIKKPNISKIEKQILTSFKELRNEWVVQRKNILDIFLTDKRLNRNKYRNTERLIIEMDNYFLSDNPVMMFEKFVKFTSSEIRGSIKNGFEPPENKFFELCDEYLGIYNRLISVLDQYIIYLEANFFEFVKYESIKIKNDQNCITYDDLLLNMYNVLAEGNSALAKSVRAKYSAALIDEFQDTDPVQYYIFDKIFGHNSILFLIGDPKQSIYKFRGADIFAYLKASKNINSRYTLGTNWRSSPGLLKAVNTIFRKKIRPFVFEEIKYYDIAHADKKDRDELIIDNKTVSPMELWIFDKSMSDKKDGIITKRRAEALASNAVSGEIFRLLSLASKDKAMIGKTPVNPRDIAVLVRKHSQAKLMESELVKYNIPCVLYGSESVWNSNEAIEIKRIIGAIISPGNERLLKTALATDILGFSGNDIFKLLDDEKKWEEYLNRFYEYHAVWTNHGFYRMFRSFTDNEGVRERVLFFTDGERRLTNILHISELIHRAEIENPGMESLLEWLDERMKNLDDSEDNVIRLETDEDAVRVITIHRSKGLEFPIVFYPFPWESSGLDDGKPLVFHNPENDYKLTLDLSSEENNRAISELEELAENMRLLYVALTRPKHQVYISWGRVNESDTSALSYILHHKNDNDPFDPVMWLKNNIKFMSFDAMMKDVASVAAASGGTINVDFLPVYEYNRYARRGGSGSGDNFSCRINICNIKKDWTVTSFSALTAGHSEYAERHYDGANYSSDSESNIKQNDYSIYSFPKGAVPGTCIHKIFENLDFSLSDGGGAKEIINRVLAEYGFDPIWQDCIYDMVYRVLNTSLLKDGDLTLNNICNNRLNELEFYFPLKSITPGGLAELFRGPESGKDADLAGSLANLGFHPQRGFVRGYIDMVFKHGERFYIIDWKSNHLGNTIADYSIEKINTAMTENLYRLQYYIYTVALHRYLFSRKDDYDYGKHFGGIFYLFVRGIDPKYPSAGIYYDLPPKGLVESLSGFLGGWK